MALKCYVYVCLVVFLGVAGARASDFYPKASSVINLDADNFDRYVNTNNTVWMVEFYAPWCGHCKALKPAWIKAAKGLNGVVKIAAVNCDEAKNKALAAKYQIQGFPTIKTFVGGKVSDYQGGRTARDIIIEARSKLPNYVSTVTDENEKDFVSTKEHDTTPRVLLFSTKVQPAALYKSIAMKFKGRLVFGQAQLTKTKGKKMKEKYFVEEKDVPQLQMVPPFNMPPVLYEGPFNARALTKFLKRFVNKTDADALDEEAEIPEVEDQSCWEHYCSNKAALCVVLNMYKEDKDMHFFDTMKTVEEKRTDSLYSFVWVDSDKHKDWLEENFGIEPQNYAQVSVVAPKKNRYALFVGSFNVENVAQFLDRVLRGKERTHKVFSGTLTKMREGDKKCEHLAKPPPPPPKQETPSSSSGANAGAQPAGLDGTSTVLTTANFNELVMQSTAPWVIEFYAPWCGHCKQLAPAWASAAKKARNMVRFGQVDGDKEQALLQRFGIQGFPTIKMFPGGKKTDKSVKDYSGGRTAKALMSGAFGLLSSEHVTVLDQTKFAGWMSASPSLSRVILFTDKQKVPSLFQALSMAFEGRLAFGQINAADKVLVDQFKVQKFPTIMIIPSPEKQAASGKKELQAHLYNGKLSFNPLSQFLNALAGSAAPKDSAPAVDKKPEFFDIKSQADFEKACKGGLCAVALMGAGAYTDKQYDDILMALATKHVKKPLTWMKAKREANRGILNEFGMSDDGPVSLVFVNPRRGRFSSFVGVFNEEGVNEHVEALLRGKMRTAKFSKMPDFANTGNKEDL